MPSGVGGDAWCPDTLTKKPVWLKSAGRRFGFIYEECRQKARLLAEGRKSPATDVRMYFQGNVVDQAMRRWLELDHPEDHPDWMVDRVDEIMDELEELAKHEDGVVRWKHKNDRAEVREFCRTAALRLEPILRHLALPYEYHPALRFKTQLTIPGLDGNPVPVLLNGEMDLLVREKKTVPQLADLEPGVITPVACWSPWYRIWDLKITKSADYWRKTVAQLVFYDIVVLCMFGMTSIEAGLIQPMVDGQQYISFAPSNEDRSQMLTRIITVAHQIMSGDDAPKADSTGCSYCEVRHGCVRYQTKPGTSSVQLF